MKKILISVFGIFVSLSLLIVTPTFASVGPLQNMITYYTGYTPTFARSVIPFIGVTSQVNNDNGSVTMSITGATAYADSGFVIYNGTLGDLNNFNLTGTGDYGLNLWFDKDGGVDPFFSWTGDIYNNVGGDSYILGPSSSGGNLSITDSSAFTSMQPGGGNYTLAQLKDGLASGITTDTHIAIWVGVTLGSGGTTSATVSIPVGLPTDKNQCKDNEWKTFTNPTFKNQGACVSYIQSNDNAGKR